MNALHKRSPHGPCRAERKLQTRFQSVTRSIAPCRRPVRQWDMPCWAEPPKTKALLQQPLVVSVINGAEFATAAV